MSAQIHIRIALLLSLAILSIAPLQASENTKNPAQATSPDPGITAHEAAAASGQFLMVLFQKTDDPSPLRESFDAVRQSMAGDLMSVIINTENPGESGLVNRCNVRWAPLPMVVILAPNSAVTRSFRTAFTQDQVRTAFLSPVSQECLLAFQQRKIVFVCVQGNATSDNDKAMEGVTRFKEDPKLGRIAQVVMIDPDDPRERDLLTQLRIGANPAVAETLLLAPPGKLLGKWTGATSKEAFTQTLIAQAGSQQTCQVPGCQDPSCPTPPASPAQGGAQ
ncbi:MAG: hypothetical protein V1793_16065 [Pseudomonadota bacterium]